MLLVVCCSFVRRAWWWFPHARFHNESPPHISLRGSSHHPYIIYTSIQSIHPYIYTSIHPNHQWWPLLVSTRFHNERIPTPHISLRGEVHIIYTSIHLYIYTIHTIYTSIHPNHQWWPSLSRETEQRKEFKKKNPSHHTLWQQS